MNGFGISPYLQDLEAYAGQDDNFEMAAQRLKKYLHIEVNSSQIDRITKHYGEQIEPGIIPQTTLAQADKNDKVYAMMDGSMLLTRKDSEWKEMKLGIPQILRD